MPLTLPRIMPPNADTLRESKSLDATSVVSVWASDRAVPDNIARMKRRLQQEESDGSRHPPYSG
jgi:hypothetical protein